MPWQSWYQTKYQEIISIRRKKTCLMYMPAQARNSINIMVNVHWWSSPSLWRLEDYLTLHESSLVNIVMPIPRVTTFGLKTSHTKEKGVQDNPSFFTWGTTQHCMFLWWHSNTNTALVEPSSHHIWTHIVYQHPLNKLFALRGIILFC